MWRKEGDCFNLYYGPTEHDNFPQTGKWLRGRSNCMFAFKQIEDAGGTPQTLVTMTQKVELAGNIPRFLLESDDKAIDNLMYNSSLRLKFDKSLNIDLKNMEDMVVAQAAHSATAVYTDEELEFIKAGESRFDIFEAGAGIEEKGLRSPLARGKVVIGRKAGSAVGWSTTRVRDSPERVLAWYVQALGAIPTPRYPNSPLHTGIGRGKRGAGNTPRTLNVSCKQRTNTTHTCMCSRRRPPSSPTGTSTVATCGKRPAKAATCV